MSVSDWSAIADNNTSVGGINIAEHCPAKNINNAIREVMAQVKAQDGTLVHQSGTETITGDKTFSGTVNVVTPASSDDSTKPATTEWVRENAPSVPVGTIIWSANATVPAGYLLCNGSAVGRATYPELFDAIGTTFGSGDGSTTFNLPNLINKFIEGGNTAGTEYQAGLPNIIGTIGGVTGYSATYGASGAFTQIRAGSVGSFAASNDNARQNFNASLSNPIYGSSTTVQPPAVTALPCIKAFSSVIGDATVVAGQLVNEIQSKVALDGSNTSSIGSTLSTYMAHAAMSSGQYIDLTLPATAGTVTAPGDGWAVLHMVTDTTATSAHGIGLHCDGAYIYTPTILNTVTLCVCIPVSKNSDITVHYARMNTSAQTNYFRFYYANGSAPAV